MSQKSCNHVEAISEIKTAAQRVCKECVKLGDGWAFTHLPRMRCNAML